MTRDDKYSEREHHLLWSGWVEVPNDPIFVLFARITSQPFLRDLQERLSKKNAPLEMARDCFVLVENIFPANPQKLYREIFP